MRSLIISILFLASTLSMSAQLEQGMISYNGSLRTRIPNHRVGNKSISTILMPKIYTLNFHLKAATSLPIEPSLDSMATWLFKPNAKVF